jgi:hypothetical protein
MQYGQGAVDQVSGQGNQWGAQASNWMNPYMKNVTDAIAQSGDQNFYNNLMPSINSQFISNGAMNSTDNARALGLGAAQAQSAITQAQSQALQQGYTGAQGAYLQDQNMKAQTGLAAGQLATTGGYLGTYAGLGAAGQQAALGSQVSGLGYTDAANQLAVGNQQQALAQQGMNTAYGQYMLGQQWPAQQLQAAAQGMQGLQVPGVTTSNAPWAGNVGPTPLGAAGNFVGNLDTAVTGAKNAWGTVSGLFGGNTPSTAPSVGPADATPYTPPGYTPSADPASTMNIPIAPGNTP